MKVLPKKEATASTFVVVVASNAEHVIVLRRTKNKAIDVGISVMLQLYQQLWVSYTEHHNKILVIK
jgi:hypothetical protein